MLESEELRAARALARSLIHDVGDVAGVHPLLYETLAQRMLDAVRPEWERQRIPRATMVAALVSRMRELALWNCT